MKTLCLLILATQFLLGQNADTLIINGQIIFFTSRKDLNRKNIDKVYDFCFIPSKHPETNKIKYVQFNKIDKARDSIFLICNGGSFVTFNELFLNNKKKPKVYDKSLYPFKKLYSYKDKRFVYKSTFAQIKCIKFNLTQKELLNIIPSEQYHFKSNNIIVFLIEEIIKTN